MSQYILSIDQGTTSSRAVLFDTEGVSQAIAQKEFPQHFPKDGWVEHDPEEIWSSVLECCHQVIEKANFQPKEILGIGITNQRETTVVWDKLTGKPIYNAIVWQDRRTSEQCQGLVDRGVETVIRKKTGLLLDPYFSATKLKWLLDNVPDARQGAESNELLFGTVDSYLLWKLTGGASHKTDASNASRTMLFNIHEQKWDQELLDLFTIPSSVLPEVLDSAADFGQTEQSLFGTSIPIVGIAGDQQAALIGQTCFESGMAKSTYGTGCFFMLNTGKTALNSKNRLLTTVAYRIKGEATYALEGSIFMAGATIQWLRDGLKMIQHAEETESLAKGLEVDHGVHLVPAFTGLGAPYWDANARGAILGLTRDTGLREIASAALLSVVYHTKDLQESMKEDGQIANQLRVDGGMVRNDWVMQFLADILGATVSRPVNTETTALGVAYLAMLQLGLVSTLSGLSGKWQEESNFKPKMDSAKKQKLYEQWKTAVKRVRSDLCKV